MTVAETVDYWRMLTQEPDSSFISDSQVTMLLRLAYREFRQTVSRYDDRYYINSVVLPISGTSYDLSTGVPSVLGATPTDPVMKRIISIRDNVTQGAIWRGVATRRALDSGGNTSANQYMLEGSTLWFENSNTGGSLLLTYEPIEAVDWTILTAATYIDNLVDYHDLIALFAARRYQAIDASDNKGLNVEIKTRTADLEDYLSGMRVVDDRYISREDGYDDGGW